MCSGTQENNENKVEQILWDKLTNAKWMLDAVKIVWGNVTFFITLSSCTGHILFTLDAKILTH